MIKFVFVRITSCLAACLICLHTGPVLAGEGEPENVPVRAEEQPVPELDIRYEKTLPPAWKDNWDLARSLYREQKYPEALVQYEILFTQKGNVEEARWEYTSILILLQRWEKAGIELEKLLAAEPENIRFLTAMAQVSMETGNMENAITLYAKLLGLQVSDDYKAGALKGLIAAHETLGQLKEAVAFVEQLITLMPLDADLRLKLADLELRSGNTGRAWELCGQLEQSRPEDAAALALCGHIAEQAGDRESAAGYWQKVVALEPENPEAHDRLAGYYFASGNWAMSFTHLEHLIKMTPNDVGLLGRAADLGMRLGRVDHALEYYEYGLAVDPLNKDLADGKAKAQKILARDLLSIVQNDGGEKLWKDLVNVAPDCEGVYREIANLLREQNQTDALIEVLTLLNEQVADDRQVYDELVSLLEKKGKEGELAALKAGRTEVNRETETKRMN